MHDAVITYHVDRFLSNVKLRSVCIVSESGAAPTQLALHINRSDINLDCYNEFPPTQAFALREDTDGSSVYPVIAPRFRSLSSLMMVMTGDGPISIKYIQLKGDYLVISRDMNLSSLAVKSDSRRPQAPVEVKEKAVNETEVR